MLFHEENKQKQPKFKTSVVLEKCKLPTFGILQVQGEEDENRVCENLKNQNQNFPLLFQIVQNVIFYFW